MKRIGRVALCLTLATLTIPCLRAETVILRTPENFQILAVSPNGKWACGVFTDAMLSNFGFRWNLESGSMDILGSQQTIAYDVANDGTVSGDFFDTQAVANGAPVEMPGYWRDGSWHHLQLPAGTLTDGIGYGISPDGVYMTGSVAVDGIYTPYIWKNGQIHRSLATGYHAVSFAVSPDGNAAAGFNQRRNRTACYWAPDGSLVHFEDSPEHFEGPWNYARNFSPDGSKLLYWGGWQLNEEATELYLYSVYDINTGERKKVHVPSLDSDLEFFDISNNSTLVGALNGRGYLLVDGEGMYIDDYLTMRGVDLSGFDDFYGGTDYYTDVMPIFRVVSLSEDDKVLALQYYDTLGQPASMIIKVDCDFSAVTPVEVKAGQLDGINTVGLTWKRPVGVSNVRGYNVYRDGRKLNGILPLNVPYYYDRNLEPGTYTYEVSAVTVAGTETRAEAVTATVADKVSSAPYSLYARQKGFAGAHLSWTSPLSDMAHKHYCNLESQDNDGFNVYMPVTVEMGVRYDKSELANYAGYKISEVSFIPMAKHDSWAVNLYTLADDGTPVLLASQAMTSEPVCRQLNTVRFDAPVEIPSADIIVAVEVTVNPDAGSVIGTESGKTIAGYTDLLRQKDESAFYSAYESSVATGLSMSAMMWMIDLGLAPGDDVSSSVVSYEVYVDGQAVGRSDTNSYVIDNLAAGDHSVAVAAIYDNGSMSPLTNGTLSISDKYKAVDEVDVATTEGSTSITASWEAPSNDDVTTISYTTAKRTTRGMKGVETNAYAILAGSIYQPSMLRGYDGYQIKSLRFYPLADALYTFMLYADGELVAEVEVDDFKIGEWNEVDVDEDVFIDSNAQYMLAIDCFDPEPDVLVLGIDSEMTFSEKSDLFSNDNGQTWQSFSVETGTVGNWMMGMVIADPQTAATAIDGYDVVIDNIKRNDQLLTETSYTYDFGAPDNIRHSLRINVYYPTRSESVRGAVNYFYISPSGIADNMVANVVLRKGDNYLVAEGESVSSMVVYSINGTEVAKADGNKVGIGHLSSGIYVVRIVADGVAVSKKINIVK